MGEHDREVDLLVLGAGAGGMTAGLVGAALGLDVLLVEKAATVGGTTALSAGSVWVPGSHHDAADDDANVLRYLRAAIGNRLRAPLAEAFIAAGPEMVRFFEQHTAVAFRAYPYHPDYLADLPGAALSGRVLEPLPFDARKLGADFGRLRPPLPEFTLFGGLMVDRTDIGHLLNVRRAASLRHTARLLLRYGADRLRHPRGTRLVMGNALAGRLLHSLLERGVPILTSTSAVELTPSEDRVTGAVLRSAEGTRTVRSRRGVVLATGGFSRHPALRRQLLPEPLALHSAVVESATGDGVTLGQQAGGHLGTDHANNSFWAPISVRSRRDGSTAVFPHFVLDRGKPGLIAVNAQGQRFVNEATTYQRFAEAIYAAHAQAPAIPCFFVCDDAFIVKYGLGMVRPRRFGLRRALAGYLLRADTLGGLAQQLAIDPAGLAQTVARYNDLAASGDDPDFGKGGDAYQRHLGDPAHGPNPCMGRLEKPPFYAIRVWPGDIGASCGLATNPSAQVIRADGTPIEGLYACGNDMDSLMAGIYPAPGITLGPAMTFGYLAARHAAQRTSTSSQKPSRPPTCAMDGRGES
jgi:succinate dehydrogenase/fumarate reductase flavoprotein subunit